MEIEQRTLNIMFRNSGGNSSKNSLSARLSVPSKWLKEMNVTLDDREVLVTFDGEKITIEKKV